MIKKQNISNHIGVEKVQLSLDSFIEEEHTTLETKNILIKCNESCRFCPECRFKFNLIYRFSKWKGEAKEFEDMCKFCQERGIGLYVSYAKPVGSATDHPEFVITKKDAADILELEKKYPVFGHMTPIIWFF